MGHLLDAREEANLPMFVASVACANAKLQLEPQAIAFVDGNVASSSISVARAG
jgi:hypothetical protein